VDDLGANVKGGDVRMHEITRGGLRASPGDRLVIRGHHLDERERDGEILEVLGEDGLPPFLVRWSDDGHVSRLLPGSDAYVEHFAHRQGEEAGR
jgi:hypothetical protein